MEVAPGLALWPGLCLTIVVYCLNMFGDAVCSTRGSGVVGDAWMPMPPGGLRERACGGARGCPSTPLSKATFHACSVTSTLSALAAATGGM